MTSTLAETLAALITLADEASSAYGLMLARVKRTSWGKVFRSFRAHHDKHVINLGLLVASHAGATVAVARAMRLEDASQPRVTPSLAAGGLRQLRGMEKGVLDAYVAVLSQELPIHVRILLEANAADVGGHVMGLKRLSAEAWAAESATAAKAAGHAVKLHA